MGWRLSPPFRPRGPKDRRLPGSQSASRVPGSRIVRNARLRPRRTEIRSSPPRCLRGGSPTAPRLTDHEPNTRGSRLRGGGFASRAVPPAGSALRFRSASQCPARFRGARNRPERTGSRRLPSTRSPGAARARRLRLPRARLRPGHSLQTTALSGHWILCYRSGVS